MEAVGDEPEGVGGHPVEQLHEGEGEVEEEEAEEVPGVGVCQDLPAPVGLVGVVRMRIKMVRMRMMRMI